MFYPDKNFINTLSNGERFIFLKIICGTVAASVSEMSSLPPPGL